VIAELDARGLVIRSRWYLPSEGHWGIVPLSVTRV
jgi:hypothetical protein